MLERVESLEGLAASIKDLINSVINNIETHPEDIEKSFILSATSRLENLEDETEELTGRTANLESTSQAQGERVSSLEGLASSIKDLTNSVIANIERGEN